MTEMPPQASKDKVITPCGKIFPVVILLEVAMITMMRVMTNQKGTKISSEKTFADFPKT